MTSRRAGPVGVGAPALLRFTLVASAAFCVLVWPSESRREVWGAWFRGCGELLLSCAWFGGDVQLRASTGLAEWVGGGARPDTAVLLDGRAIAYVDSASMGFLPMAVLVALLAATPRGLGRRLRGLVRGGLLVQVFIALRLLVLILYAVTAAADSTRAVASVWTKTLTHQLHSIVNVEIPLAFAAPALIWLLTTFRREDLLGLQLPRGPASGSRRVDPVTR